MWNETYQALTNADRERFGKIVNHLLAHSFLTREIYEPRDRIGKINGDYRFVERFMPLFSEYLEVAGYILERDDALGVLHLHNNYDANLVRLDKLTTLMLLTLREMYDSAREQATPRNVVFVSTADLLLALLNKKLLSKRPTIKETLSALRILLQHNILSRLEGNLDSSDAVFVLYPTILKVVTNEKINAIYKMIFHEDDDTEITQGEENAA